jgi:hypothetical protein
MVREQGGTKTLCTPVRKWLVTFAVTVTERNVFSRKYTVDCSALPWTHLFAEADRIGVLPTRTFGFRFTLSHLCWSKSLVHITLHFSLSIVGYPSACLGEGLREGRPPPLPVAHPVRQIPFVTSWMIMRKVTSPAFNTASIFSKRTPPQSWVSLSSSMRTKTAACGSHPRINPPTSSPPSQKCWSRGSIAIARRNANKRDGGSSKPPKCNTVYTVAKWLPQRHRVVRLWRHIRSDPTAWLMWWI